MSTSEAHAANPPSRRPHRSRPPETALGALRIVVDRMGNLHPDTAEVVLSLQRKPNQSRQQQPLSEAQSEADRKAKRRNYDRARRKRIKEAKIIKSREAEERARQIREERREAARQQAKATPSPPSLSLSVSGFHNKQPTTTSTDVNGDHDHV